MRHHELVSFLQPASQLFNHVEIRNSFEGPSRKQFLLSVKRAESKDFLRASINLCIIDEMSGNVADKQVMEREA